MSIDQGEGNSTVQSYVDTKGIKYPAISGTQGGGDAVNTTYGIPAYPTTILIAPNRDIIEQDLWPLSTILPALVNADLEEHDCDPIDEEAPVVEVTSPESGDVLDAGIVHNITWTATDNIAVVSRAIYFSADSRATWTIVDSSEDNTGTYSWTVPDDISENCKIKVFAYDAAKNVGSDESDVFAIDSASNITFNLKEVADQIILKKTPKSFMAYIPFSGSYTVTISDVHGKRIASFSPLNSRGWYKMPVSLSSGIHIVSLRTPERTIVKKLCFVR